MCAYVRKEGVGPLGVAASITSSLSGGRSQQAKQSERRRARAEKQAGKREEQSFIQDRVCSKERQKTQTMKKKVEGARKKSGEKKRTV